ncbi:MAG: aminotransferase class III-fold pyridoxal phosphate-dependent enzyme [Leucobacter sp.]
MTDRWTQDDASLQHGTEWGGAQQPVTIVKGSGSTVWDEQGRSYLDANAGAWLCSIGHAEPEMAEAARKQILEIEHYTVRREFTTPPANALAARIVRMSGIEGGKVRFTCSGSEADDDAFQIVQEHFRRLGKPEKRKLITLSRAFHGHCLSGRLLNGTTAHEDVVQVAMPDPSCFDGDASDLVDACLRELRETIEREGAQHIAAMFGEPVFGDGMVPAPAGYWRRAVDLLREHDILFVADEVATGFGRTGRMFGCEHDGITPDVMILAKGITSGYAAVAAIVISPEIAASTRGFPSGGSFAGQALGCALAMKNLDIVEQRDLVANAEARGRQFLGELAPATELPGVHSVHGLGLMIGLRLEHPWQGAKPLDQIIREEHGVLVDGTSSAQHILLTPPLIITEAEVSAACRAIIAVCRDHLPRATS